MRGFLRSHESLEERKGNWNLLFQREMRGFKYMCRNNGVVGDTGEGIGETGRDKRKRQKKSGK
jgi:hypothetical protein